MRVFHFPRHRPPNPFPPLVENTFANTLRYMFYECRSESGLELVLRHQVFLFLFFWQAEQGFADQEKEDSE